MSHLSHVLLPRCTLLPLNSTASSAKQFSILNLPRKCSRSLEKPSSLHSNSSFADIGTTIRRTVSARRFCSSARKQTGRIISIALPTGIPSELFTVPGPSLQERNSSSFPAVVGAVADGVQQGLRLDGDEEKAEEGRGDGGRRSGEEGNGDDDLPTMEDIVAAAAEKGVKLQVKSLGPAFEIVVSSVIEEKEYGKAYGWIKVWTKGLILHLETVALDPGLTKQVGGVFGAGFFVGASTLRYGLDRGCRTAELLAIYDDEATHAKLVKYYTRLGFKTLYDVDEEDWKYFADRLVWGGIGTRMDADCEELLRKWSKALKPKAKLEPASKGNLLTSEAKKSQ